MHIVSFDDCGGPEVLRDPDIDINWYKYSVSMLTKD